jgi:hypothetical protein
VLKAGHLLLRNLNSAEGGTSSKVNVAHLDDLAIQLNGANLEVDANGRDVAVSVGIISETEKQAGLADTGIANQQKLMRRN